MWKIVLNNSSKNTQLTHSIISAFIQTWMKNIKFPNKDFNLFLIEETILMIFLAIVWLLNGILLASLRIIKLLKDLTTSRRHYFIYKYTLCKTWPFAKRNEVTYDVVRVFEEHK